MAQRPERLTQDVRQEIQALSGIAVETAERLPQEFFESVTAVTGNPNTPAARYNAKRYGNLAPFIPIEGEPSDATTQQAAERLQDLRLNKELPGNAKVGEAPLRPVRPALFDRNETVELYLEAALTSEDQGKRDELARAVKQKSDASTQAFLEKVDSGERVVEDVVIVGGSLLASVAATTAAYAGAKVTVISNQELGEPWLDQPIFINSATEATFGGTDLPTLPGSTTPITPSFQNNAVEAGRLTKTPGEVLTCECKDPDVPQRKYVAGPGLGLVAALNIVSAADQVATKQNVDPRRLRINEDGTKTLTIVDQETGKERTIDAKLVLFLSGPGKERFGIKDDGTRALYEAGASKLSQDIADAQSAIDALNEKIAGLAGDDVTRQAYIAERDAITVELPKILSFTQIKAAYKFWVDNGRRGPSPLLPLSGVGSDGPVRTAIAGGGDTALVEAELLLGRGPASAYPAGFERDMVNADVTIYNPPSADTEDFRTRYQGIIGDPRTEKLPGERVASARLLKNDSVAVTTEDGTIRLHDYLLVSTGLERSPVPDELAEAFRLQGYEFGDVLDVTNQRVALGSAELGVIVAGSATNFTAADFPPQVEALIKALQIRENTISVWVNSLLLQRCLLSLGINKQLPLEKMPNRLYEGLPAQPLRPSAAELILALSNVRLEVPVESLPAVLAEQGPFTGIFNDTRPYNAFQLTNTANSARSLAMREGQPVLLPTLEAVGNQLLSTTGTQLNPSTMSVGANSIISRANIRNFEEDALRFYRPQEQISALYGFFGAALAVGSPGFIDALDRIATLQQRPLRAVITEVLPIISAVRTARPDLNLVGGSRRGDGRPVLTIDDTLRQAGFFWNPTRNTHEYVSVRQYADSIDDPRVAALVTDGQAIIKAIDVNRVSVAGSATREQREVVQPYTEAIAEQLIVDAIRNPDLLLNEVAQQRLDGLSFRLNIGIREAAAGTQIRALEQELRGRARFTREQFIDTLYGYFALTVATGSTRALDGRFPESTALYRIAQLRSEVELRSVTIQEVIDEVLPLINRARTERPDRRLEEMRGTFSSDQRFPFDQAMITFGYAWDGQQYRKR